MFAPQPPTTLWRTLAEDFVAVRPDIRIRWVADARPLGKGGLALIGSGNPVPTGYVPAPLAPQLVDTSTLLPGLTAPFQGPGVVYGLPVAIEATGLRYTAAVEATPGAVPGPDWTATDFEEACALVSAQLGSPSLFGTTGVLPLVAGRWQAVPVQRRLRTRGE